MQSGGIREMRKNGPQGLRSLIIVRRYSFKDYLAEIEMISIEITALQIFRDRSVRDKILQ